LSAGGLRNSIPRKKIVLRLLCSFKTSNKQPKALLPFPFIHVSRSCNEVAHSLARSTRSTDKLPESVWFHEAPKFIRASLYNQLVDWIKSYPLL
jgi:hypothetical protein